MGPPVVVMEGKVAEKEATVGSTARAALTLFIKDNRLTKEKLNGDLAQAFETADRFARGCVQVDLCNCQWLCNNPHSPEPSPLSLPAIPSPTPCIARRPCVV